MFTPIKRALTALIITASLLTPISANAGELSREASVETLAKGRILSVADNGAVFVIEYRGKIIRCMVGRPQSSGAIFISCSD